MAKKNQCTTVEQAVRNGFTIGLVLGHLLAQLPNRAAAKVTSKSQGEIEKILQEEIDRIFKIVDDRQSVLEW